MLAKKELSEIVLHKYTMVIIYFLLHFILHTSCQDKDRHIERVNVSIEMVSDSIHSRMPGTLLKLNDYLVWHDPFGLDDFMHIIDLKDGREIGTMGKTGQGPEEFNTPVISSAGNDKIFVFDLNTNHQAFYSINSLKNNESPYTRYKNNDLEKITHKIYIGKDQFIVLQPSQDKRFRFIKDGNISDFGSPIIEDKDIENKYNIYQGEIKFHPKRKSLVFASYRFPYIEIYDFHKEDVFLHFSSVISKNLYSRQGNEIKTDPTKKGCMDMTLTKDYIVTIQRDYTTDNTDESKVGMDFDKVPRTLFLYDYDGNIKKIVNLGIPVFRVAGNTEDNTVYATGVAPEVVIGKCEL
jgi:hypothetical protein